MICRECACSATQIDTKRAKHGLFHVRLYECIEGHVFETIEVYPGNVDARTLVPTVDGIMAAAAAAGRRLHVKLLLRAGEQNKTHIAQRVGVTAARVRQIARKEKR